ncbi:hypothetical protein NUU61_009599 [Penicillium alfredii]|uniref:Cytochrome P450 n=1 Tax=Penicillium alfredii TaxID=1506179 RepID=A0A9W9EGJ1_9EURO|nr:uncharacterized protein NUU61_009599 [Penicillium alfredii]KAJ5081335.1 hypothetical protein NUU61_009599 [Penicillium alfredii]
MLTTLVGVIVRTAPNTLSFDSHDTMPEIYGIKANVRKANEWVALSASRRTPNVLSVVDKQLHAFKRRTLAHVFYDQNMKHIEDRIIEKIKGFTDLLGSADDGLPVKEKNSWGSPTPMTNPCNWLSFDIISDLTYSQSFNMLKSPELRWVPEVYTSMSYRSMVCLIQPKIFECKLDRVLLARLYKEIISAGTWIYERTKTRQSLGVNPDKKDIFSILMNARDLKTGSEYKTKDLWIESILLLAAGADTTSATMSAAFFYLLHNQAALSHLTAEVRATFTSEDEIRMGPKMNSCRYLQACINETMRLVPAVPNLSPRRVQAGGITVGGEYIPEGVNIGTSLYTLMRNEHYFQKPNEFWPERWFVDPEAGVTPESLALAQKVFCPFGMGPRSCVGWKLAWLELNVTLARTLFLYDMRLPLGTDSFNKSTAARSDYDFQAWAIASGGGHRAQFRRRHDLQ